MNMDEAILRRCVTVAQYMLEKRATVRQAAAAFKLSKSSVHKDMCVHLPKIDARLGREVAALLEYNKAVRHLRGGEATRRRYQGLQSGTNEV
jgi:putative DeoR family transcriptional regulator (stage III sporulation protein D)